MSEVSDLPADASRDLADFVQSCREKCDSSTPSPRYVFAVRDLADTILKLAERIISIDAQLEAVTRERDEARDVLKRYGTHLYGCTYSDDTYNDGPWPCSCGFDAARAAASAGDSQT